MDMAMRAEQGLAHANAAATFAVVMLAASMGKTDRSLKVKRTSRLASWTAGTIKL